ncbi:nucleotidyltransferase family protein [Thermocoleostomius sinensis]|uniref:Glucose-1-phosphate thymidylyltransferase n=1 Tax=Thermocoleostomius sinensis A174 TaxID=2016057 RepID=A0A9E8ZHP1_9CYAN|nr:sugar phosphate nucleotidyltransferase [Thermocoleostomius sinensis]WAL61478.1 sugar phosphate nucleotidyltransferase [Thermocoleostomius sinensis A174]
MNEFATKPNPIDREIIGLLPAAGQATRLAPLPLSKELYPIGFYADSANQPKPKVVSHYLLESMQQAGARKAFFIVRPGKWDIPAYFGDGSRLNLPLGYLTVHVSYGVPFTLDQAYPFVQQAQIIFGFPDILFQPKDAFSHLMAHQTQTHADIVLGLFPTENYHKVGVVEFDDIGRVQQIIEKPAQTTLKYMWAIATWMPTFTQFLHDYLPTCTRDRELPIGDVIQAGIDAGLSVQAVPFANGSYLDIGTPDDLAQAIRSAMTEPTQTHSLSEVK